MPGLGTRVWIDALGAQQWWRHRRRAAGMWSNEMPSRSRSTPGVTQSGVANSISMPPRGRPASSHTVVTTSRRGSAQRLCLEIRPTPRLPPAPGLGHGDQTVDSAVRRLLDARAADQPQSITAQHVRERPPQASDQTSWAAVRSPPRLAGFRHATRLDQQLLTSRSATLVLDALGPTTSRPHRSSLRLRGSRAQRAVEHDAGLVGVRMSAILIALRLDYLETMAFELAITLGATCSLNPEAFGES